MKQTRYYVPLLIAALAALALILSGCGGGGESDSRSDVHGTVADLDRNVVVDADVWIGEHHGVSLVSGAFRLQGVPSGWQTLRASAVVDGRTWEGSTAVEVLEGRPTMNANVVLMPAGDATSITGRVFDNHGGPISGARVLFTTRLTSDDNGPYGSIVAVTDSRGNYRLDKVPVGVDAAVMASKVAFNNEEERRTVTDRMVIDFTLYPSVEDTPDSPEVTDIYSWTMPNPIVRSLSAGITGEGNPYDAVKTVISPNFRELLKSAKTPSVQTASVRAASPAGLIEVDLSWRGVAGSLASTIAGYGVYRWASGGGWEPIEFVRDPYANFYADMDPNLQPDREYAYAVSAVNIEFLDWYNEWIDDAESVPTEYDESITPLGYLRAASPSNGAGVGSRPVFTWNTLYRATDYIVLVYDEFPRVLSGSDYVPAHVTLPIWDSGWISDTSVQCGVSLPGGQYFWVVTAVDADGTAYSYSELRSFVVD